MRKQLRHHAVEAGSLGDAVAVPAMMAHDEVAHIKSSAGARRHGFLPDIAVRGSLHVAFQKEFARALVEPTDPDHRREKAEEQVFVVETSWA